MMNRNVHKLVMGLSLAVVGLAGVAAQAQSAAEKALLAKAQALEQSGHIDLAAQSWQQVLLSDPNSQEALAGLARWAKLAGNDAESQKYMEQLRQLNPKSPAIARIESLVSKRAQNQMLQQAAELAKTGHPEQALKIYRVAFGAQPPDSWAQAYYDAEAAIPSLRDDAVAGLRGLMAKYPGNAQYAIDLGRILTYDPRTRTEGERLLSQYPQDTEARTVLRQALEWDVQNPASAAEVRQFLREHPDEDLAQELQETEQRQAKAANGLARTPAEQQAFRALAENHLEEAQRRFLALTARQPKNARVLAGLGFLRMKQGNFRQAVDAFEQAEKNGLHSTLVQQSLATSRFWDAMQSGTEAMGNGQPEEAVRQYRAALALRPGNQDALTGLAGAYMKMQQPAQAVPVYAQLVKKEPRSAAMARGLFMAEAQAGDAKAALATTRQFPAALASNLARDPEYLRTLASVYVLSGQDAEAQKTLLQAVNLHYPPSAASLRTELMLEYAALLGQDREYPQAAAVYRSMLTGDPDDVHAWQGLVSLEHQAGRDPDAITMVERMPPEAYENALRDGGFLSMLAAIYQSQNHPDVAQQFVERAVKLCEDQGEPLPIPLQLQIAAIDLGRNHPDAAYRIYRGVLTEHPERLDAWKGLLAAMHGTDHDADALAQIEQIPPEVRQKLETDIEYQQTAAAIDAANGQQQAALGMLARIEAYYRTERRVPPADVEIQNAWLLFNTGDDRDLYGQLMTLGDRRDMTDDQRRQVQTIWASWAQRRASEAAAQGNPRRGIEILTAAARAFPGNPAVSKALAVGYVQAGQPKDAMAIYQSLDMTNATAADYSSMVGAALAAQNMKQAEAWLREGLEKFPKDPRVLSTAARFEQARGDRTRAAAYWRASLNAMPAVTPSTKLAHTLDQPDLVPPTKTPHGNDLASLLNPDEENGAQQEFSGVPLPGYNHPNATMVASNQPYGPDPYFMGTAPVQIVSSAPAPSDASASALLPPPVMDDSGAPAPTVPARKKTTKRSSRPIPESSVDEAPQEPAAVSSSRGTPAMATEPQVTQAAIPTQEPQQVVLETSPALTPIPSAGAKILAGARKAVDPAMVPTQYAAPSQEIAQEQTQSLPSQSYERPPALFGNARQEEPSTTPGASDDQLMQQNLPPLRGAYMRPAVVRQRDLRQEAQQQLATIEGGYSPWMGGTGLVNHRSGTPGYDALTALEAPFEASAPLGRTARLTVITRPVFLDTGQPTTAPVLPGGVAEQLGTAPVTAILTQQNASGVGGELQLAMPNFAASVGYTPYGFLVANTIGRMSWKPGNGPFTFTFNRDAVRDSQLSYAGLRDPGSTGPGYEGNVWGGVIATGGEVQFGRGTAASGYYVSAGGQYIDGVHVQNNNRVDGDAGAYWLVKAVPDTGSLTLGANFFGMHYAHNLQYLTYGQGGYFSPQEYFLANIPVSWQARRGMNFHYSVVGAFGLQAFAQDSSLYFPLDPALEIANKYPSYAPETVVGGNYDLRSEGAYHLTDHWYAGAFLDLNNTRDYNDQVIGFYVRFLQRPQVPTDAGPTGLYPWDGLRPFQAP